MGIKRNRCIWHGNRAVCFISILCVSKAADIFFLSAQSHLNANEGRGDYTQNTCHLERSTCWFRICWFGNTFLIWFFVPDPLVPYKISSLYSLCYWTNICACCSPVLLPVLICFPPYLTSLLVPCCSSLPYFVKCHLLSVKHSSSKQQFIKCIWYLLLILYLLFALLLNLSPLSHIFSYCCIVSRAMVTMNIPLELIRYFWLSISFIYPTILLHVISDILVSCSSPAIFDSTHILILNYFDEIKMT